MESNSQYCEMEDMYNKMVSIIQLIIKSKNSITYPDFIYGALLKSIPKKPPEHGDTWENVLLELENIIIPKLVNSQYCGNLSFFPIGGSMESGMMDMFSSMMGLNGFSWMNGPGIVELDKRSLEWLRSLYGLDSYCSPNGKGSFVSSTSEGTFLAVYAAKHRLLQSRPEIVSMLDKIVVYTSSFSHASVLNAIMYNTLNIRICKPKRGYRLLASDVKPTVLEDLSNGMIPCAIVATSGNTCTGSFDDLLELSMLCKEYDMWLHSDASFGGNTLVCREMKYMQGYELANSITINPCKLLGIMIPCSTLWFKSDYAALEMKNITTQYLAINNNTSNWSVSMSSVFYGLKVWCCLKYNGKRSLQDRIRYNNRNCMELRNEMAKDHRIRVMDTESYGMVVFELVNTVITTKMFYELVLSEKKVFFSACHIEGVMYIRLVPNMFMTNRTDLIEIWEYLFQLLGRFE